jgi:hypothetical protein
MARDPFYEFAQGNHNKIIKGMQRQTGGLEPRPPRMTGGLEPMPPRMTGGLEPRPPQVTGGAEPRPGAPAPTFLTPNPGATVNNWNQAFDSVGGRGAANVGGAEVNGYTTGGGFGTGPMGNNVWSGGQEGFNPYGTLEPKNQERVPQGSPYSWNPGPEQPQMAAPGRPPAPPALPPMPGEIGFAPNPPAASPFSSLFNTQTTQGVPVNKQVSEAWGMFPGWGQGIPTPSPKPINGYPSPKPMGGPPTPKPSNWGMGGPLGPRMPGGPVRGPSVGPGVEKTFNTGGAWGVEPGQNMGEFGAFGSDPFGYGGNTEPGTVGGGFAGAGYGSPSYGVNPAQAAAEANAAAREGFSYGGYGGTTNGAGVGGGAGYGGKIVCTAMNEAYGFGGFRNAVWLMYASSSLTPAHERGYHAIFLPLLRYARGGKSKPRTVVWTALQHIARERTADIRAEMRGGKRRLLGRMYRVVLEPLCYVVGKAVNPKS